MDVELACVLPAHINLSALHSVSNCLFSLELAFNGAPKEIKIAKYRKFSEFSHGIVLMQHYK